MAFQRYQVLIPRTCEHNLIQKSDLVDVIKLRILKRRKTILDYEGGADVITGCL